MSVTEDILGMEGLEPTIHRKYDATEENVFKNSLAKAYNVNPDEITVDIEGRYRMYKINGHVIFRDINNGPSE
jgi:hypothetical protein